MEPKACKAVDMQPITIQDESTAEVGVSWRSRIMKSDGRRKASSRPATTTVHQDTVPPLLTELLATKFHTRAVKGYESEDRPNSDSKVICKSKRRCHVSLGYFKKSRRAKGTHPAARNQKLPKSHHRTQHVTERDISSSKQANAELPENQASAHTPPAAVPAQTAIEPRWWRDAP